jgi:hypothetical protein
MTKKKKNEAYWTVDAQRDDLDRYWEQIGKYKTKDEARWATQRLWKRGKHTVVIVSYVRA